MKEKTKFVLGTSFKSLINNDAAIEGGKKAPWWMALIFFIFSIILPLLPVMTNQLKVNGQDMFSSGSFNMDRYTTASLLECEKNNIEFEIVDGKCVMKNNGVVDEKTTKSDAMTPLFTYESTRKEVVVDSNGVKQQTENVLNQYEFNLYYCGLNLDEPQGLSVNEMITELKTKRYVYGTKALKNAETDPSDTKYYVPSFMIIYKTGFFIGTFMQDSDVLATSTSFAADFAHTADCKLLERVLTVKDITGTDRTALNAKYVEGVFNNFKGVINESYINTKTKSTWISIGIYGGVYTVLIVLMGFMLWILTRGKNNPFNYFNFWTTSKIAGWAAFSPALLGMIFGFIIPKFAPFTFIVFLGLRIMWLSMKSLRPEY